MAGRGSHSPAGKRALGSRKASRGQTPTTGATSGLRALRVEVILKSLLSQGLRLAAGYLVQDRKRTEGRDLPVEDPPSSLRSPRLCLCGPLTRGSL